jgi:hypothetical protein
MPSDGGASGVAALIAVGGLSLMVTVSTTIFLFKNDICRDGLQTRGDAERYGSEIISSSTFNTSFLYSTILK